MSQKSREFYDLESLWTVGYDFDGIVNDPDDPLITLLTEHTFSLADFQPASSQQSSTKNERK